jgi:hypothetical protein
MNPYEKSAVLGKEEFLSTAYMLMNKKIFEYVSITGIVNGHSEDEVYNDISISEAKQKFINKYNKYSKGQVSQVTVWEVQ